jgi:hypothetical protein
MRDVERSKIRKCGIDRLMVYLEGLFARLFRSSLSVPDHRSSREAAQCTRQPILAGPAWYRGSKCTPLMQIMRLKDTPQVDSTSEAYSALDH